MRDDDPFNYAARAYERLLEIRAHLANIQTALYVLVILGVIWFVWSVHTYSK
jgi:hypothetical protein